MKLMGCIILTCLCLQTGAIFPVRIFYADLSLFPQSLLKLEEILQHSVEPLSVRVHEFEDVASFIRETGAPYWIKGFTNHQGIFIQSRHLLRNQFDGVLEHELLHWTLKQIMEMPAWMEEGLVCWVTGELDHVKHIPPMDDIENRSIQDLQNPWEMTAYSLGAMYRVQYLFGRKEEAP